jgi:hypothetical protein
MSIDKDTDAGHFPAPRRDGQGVITICLNAAPPALPWRWEPFAHARLHAIFAISQARTAKLLNGSEKRTMEGR